jgi:hypothetical protein
MSAVDNNGANYNTINNPNKKRTPKGRAQENRFSLENTPIIGSIGRTVKEIWNPEIGRQRRARQICTYTPTSKKDKEEYHKLVEQVEGHWKQARSNQATPSENIHKPEASKPVKIDPLAGFELTNEDIHGLKGAAIFAASLYFPILLLPLMSIGRMLPALPIIQQGLKQFGLPDDITPILTTILPHFNTSYLVTPTMLGTILTQVTSKNLFNPIGFLKSLWKCSAPGMAVNRFASTQKQLTRSWKGILACYDNLGTASTVDVIKNFAVHIINATAATTSYYLTLNGAFQTAWYFSTVISNRIEPWVGTSNVIKNLNQTCPAAESFSFWNLVGLTENPWKTLFSYNDSVLWDFLGITYSDRYRTPIFVCGSRNFPSLSEAVTTGWAYIGNIIRQ